MSLAHAPGESTARHTATSTEIVTAREMRGSDISKPVPGPECSLSAWNNLRLTAAQLHAGQAAINPRGVWHTADVHEPGSALFITPGRGTEHRPR